METISARIRVADARPLRGQAPESGQKLTKAFSIASGILYSAPVPPSGKVVAFSALTCLGAAEAVATLREWLGPTLDLRYERQP